MDMQRVEEKIREILGFYGVLVEDQMVEDFLEFTKDVYVGTFDQVSEESKE